MVELNTVEMASGDAVSAAVRRCLGEREAMTLEQLVVRSGMPALTMAWVRRRMGDGGQVEVFRSLSGVRGELERGERRRRVLYRLVRDGAIACFPLLQPESTNMILTSR